MNKRFFLTVNLFLLAFTTISFGQNPINVAGTASHTATQSGNWSASSTWGGSVPTTDARVLIPSGITVTVDSQISTEFKSILIQGGTLRFDNSVNTELRVEYIVSDMSGSLEIGTASNPIGDGVIARLVIADRGGTNTTDDPERFAPGAVLMGPVTMHGQMKTSWETLQANPSAGSTSLILDTAPVNWKVGDQLVVAATLIDNPTSDDVVTISSISGNTINFNTSLVYDHKPPSQASDLKVHVANLTRNIKISSENTSTSAKRRGHLMFMHHLNVDMRYVELTHMGRTDKRIPLDDYSWNELQEDASYVPPRGAYTNPRGRYSIHFHRGGFDPSLTPAHVEGVTVNNDPGWGFVNHSARVDFVKNVSYDVLGGAFMTEAGDETGSFIDNIALRSVNPDDPLSDVTNPNALVDLREEFQDFSWQGDAFWFHSMGVTVTGNIAAGASAHGFIIWPEGLIENGLGMRRGDVNLHITDAAQRATLNGVPSNFVLECWLIPSKTFANNIAYSTRKGLTGYYVQTRFLEETEEKYNVPTEAYYNTLNAVFDNFTIWNFRNKGVEFLYASNVTLQNSRIVGYNSLTSTVGVDVDHWHNTNSWFLTNNTVEGFNNSNIGLTTPLNATVNITGGNFNNQHTDIEIKETNFVLNLQDQTQYGDLARTMTISSITFQNPNRNIVMNARFTLNQEVQDGIDFPDDSKNTLYFLLNDNITLNYGPFNNSPLYFNEQEASFVPITNSNYILQTPPGDPPSDVVVPVQYRNKTNAQLQGITNNPSTSFGGELLPAGTVDHPTIVGGKILASTLSLEEQAFDRSFRLYPNPTTGVIEIDSQITDYSIQIFGINGVLYREISHQNLSSRVDLSGFVSGLYLIRVINHDDGSTFIKKVVKR